MDGQVRLHKGTAVLLLIDSTLQVAHDKTGRHGHDVRRVNVLNWPVAWARYYLDCNEVRWDDMTWMGNGGACQY